jgi:NAD-dependent DNA ligase
MPSEKLAGILLTRTNLSSNEIEQLSEVEGWRIVYELDKQEAVSRQQNRLPEICFTGFNKTDKNRLIELASTAGFVVKEAVTKELVLLIAGENAGPSKLKKAEAQNCPITDESGFIAFLESR